jgi:peptidoglycan/LPS O-acetylase OafA/YrhL
MTTATAAATGAPPRGADLAGRALLALCALSTAAAFADGVTRVAAAPAEWVLTEFWRTAAYLVFAGMWALLAARPRSQRGMWELIVLHKVLVTVQALLVLDLPGAAQTAWVDGGLVAATVTAWVLCRGWLTWRRPPTAGA